MLGHDDDRAAAIRRIIDQAVQQGLPERVDAPAVVAHVAALVAVPSHPAQRSAA